MCLCVPKIEPENLQFSHVKMDIAPGSAENVPEPHDRHLVLDMAASSCEYVPTRPKKYMLIIHEDITEFT